MTPRPGIVVLDDNRPQLLAIRAALQGLGDVRVFVDPEAALDSVKAQAADVAIVDIHMPDLPTNGMDFIRSLRLFDHDLSVIIRTGDDSAALADEAIEVRAFRRVIKGRTSVDALRALTADALAETRDRRVITRNARESAEVKTQLITTLGSVDDELNAAEGCKAMLQSMRNGLTAVSGLAEILWETSNRGGNALLKEQASNNRDLVNRLLVDVHAFLDGPYAESMRATRSLRVATANGVLRSVHQRFQASSKWLAEHRSPKVLGLSQDMYVGVPPLKLVTALRHLLEFCLIRSAPDSEVRLTAHCIERAANLVQCDRGSNLVFNELSLSDATIYVAFRIRATLADCTLAAIRRAIEDHCDDPRTANLQMLAALVDQGPNALIIRQPAIASTVFDLLIPSAR